MPRIIGEDSEIVRRMVLEAAETMGCTALFYELKDNTYTKDFYNDPNTIYKAPITLEVLFDENPKVKVLKNLGWYNEDEEIRPLLIYLPIYRNVDKDLLNVMENCLIELVYFGVNKKASFRIQAKRLDSLFGNYWICKCCPERNIQFNPDLSDGYDYLNIMTIPKEKKSSESLTASDSVFERGNLSSDDSYAMEIMSGKEMSHYEDVGVEDLSSVGITSGDEGNPDETSETIEE